MLKHQYQRSDWQKKGSRGEGDLTLVKQSKLFEYRLSAPRACMRVFILSNGIVQSALHQSGKSVDKYPPHSGIMDCDDKMEHKSTDRP
jgi:hypothetical protein